MAESINQYEVAAGERLLDALAIAVAEGRSTSRGCAYLLGFVIEMVLKAAFFRVWGADHGQPVALGEIAQSIGRKRPRGGEGHDLKMLRDALVAQRRSRGLVLDAALTAELVDRIDRAAAIWSVDLRYDGRPLKVADIGTMFDDATWVYTQRLALAQ